MSVRPCRTLALTIACLSCSAAAWSQPRPPDAPSAAGTAGSAQLCQPGTDVRPLLRLSPDDIAAIAEPERRRAVATMMKEQCSPSASATQRLASRLLSPIRIAIPEQCGTFSFYSHLDGLMVLNSYPPCSTDTLGSFFHELTHALVSQRLGPSMASLVAHSGPGHDTSIIDREDRTLLLTMDARTSPFQALNEGLADAVSMVLMPSPNRTAPYLNQLTQESRSSSWRELTWRDQQSNEWFVTAVLASYLSNPNPAGAYDRLDHILEIEAARHPHSLEELLVGLMDRDPVQDKDQIDAALHRFHSHWDSELRDVRRAQRETAR
jgi:hypothetical protein